MLDRKTAREISGLCVEKIDWTIVGIEGGTVTIFTGRDRYHASYGAEGDPVKETGKSGEPGGECRFELDGTASPDHPVICTVSVHDGKAATDVRHMPPMFDEEAYEYVANMELDRRFVHDWSGEYHWPDWPNDTAEAWRQFREEIGSIICREILSNPPSDPNPTPRTAEFYKTRPCVRMVMTAAGILDDYIAEHPVGTPTKPDMEQL